MRPSRFLLALLLLLPRVAQATWLPNGNPISTAATSPSHQTLASDGAGGFYVAWAAAGNAYAQRVLADGSIAPGWPVDGLAITTSGNADSPFVVLGEDRWALVLWETAYAVRLQWVSPEGSVYLPPDNPMNVISGGVANLAAVTDGAGGAYIAWSKSSAPGSTTAYVTHIDSEGTFAPPYTASGIALATNTYILSIRLEPAPAGGVAWAVNSVYDGPFIHYRVHVGTASAGGAVVATRVGFSDDDSEGVATSDGQGGVLAHWTSYDRYHVDPDGPLLQHVDAAGLKTWPDTLSSPGFYAALLRDGSGGLYELVAAGDPTRVEARRHLANGTLAPGWPVTIAQKPLVDDALGILPVTAGFIACWSDGATDLDVHAIGLQSDGGLAPGWPAGGVPLTALAGNQENVVVLPTPTEGLFAVWQDSRPGAAGVDLYATRVEVHPPVAVDPPHVAAALAFRSIAPNPARSSVRVELALADGEPATLELIDVRGRVLQRAAAKPATTLATDALPAGLYWLRATQGALTKAQRLVILR